MSLDSFLIGADKPHKTTEWAIWSKASLPAVLLFCIALGLRFYRLTTNPLWLDELYGYQVLQKGLPAILLTGLHEAHPPFYYLLEWVLSGFRASQSVFAWRWLPALCGSLTVPLVYLSARKVSSPAAAFICSLMLAISPTHLYFSQEARAYVLLALLAASTPFLLLEISQDPSRKAPWIGLLILTIVGLYSSYNYILIAGAQAACLAIYYHRLRLLKIYLGVLAAFTLVLLPFAYIGTSLLVSYPDRSPLTLTYAAGAMFAGEPIRYGSYWAHFVFPIFATVLILPGMWRILRRKSPGLLSHYYVLQLLLTFVFVFIMIGVLKMSLLGKDTKQFIELLPVIYILMSSGLYFLQQKLPPAAFFTLAVFSVGLIIFGSLPGLQRYWSISKSPEGDAALRVKQMIHPGDAVVSLHYSTDAALDFYLPAAELFTNPQASGGELYFSDSALNASSTSSQPLDLNRSITQVRKHPRIWLLTREGYKIDIADQLRQGCTLLNTWQYPPFLISLLANCS